MEGSGVNIYKWVAEDVGHLDKYHFVLKQGTKLLTQAQAEEIQAKEFNHARIDQL